MAGEYVRNPNSTCFLRSTWTAMSEAILNGSRRAAPGSRGIVVIEFRRVNKRTGKRYKPYTIDTPFTLRRWQNWFRSGKSSGGEWNAEYIYRV